MGRTRQALIPVAILGMLASLFWIYYFLKRPAQTWEYVAIILINLGWFWVWFRTFRKLEHR